MLYGVWTTVCQFIWISSTSSKHKAGDSSCRTSKHTWQPFMLLWDTDNPIYHICLARENESGKERKRRRGEVIINSLFCSSSTWSEPRGPEALSEASPFSTETPGEIWISACGYFFYSHPPSHSLSLLHLTSQFAGDSLSSASRCQHHVINQFLIY